MKNGLLEHVISYFSCGCVSAKSVKRQRQLESFSTMTRPSQKTIDKYQTNNNNRLDNEIEREKLACEARKKFNVDPKKGIEHLIESDIIENEAESIANYLLMAGGLNKTQIGKYLGENNDYNRQVLRCFIDAQPIQRLNILQALRQFLYSFRIPGESQVIGRIVEMFAKRYNEVNPTALTNDALFMLCFSFIMLNTDLHNPSVKEKMTFDQYKRVVMEMVKKESSLINVEDSLPFYYETLKNEPLELDSDDADDMNMTFFEAEKEGWMLKQGGNLKTWKRRWFVLANSCLFYFQYSTDKEPKGIIPLSENLSVRQCDASLEKYGQYTFEIYQSHNRSRSIKACKKTSDGSVHIGKHEVYKLCTSSEEERDDWMDKISKIIQLVRKDFISALTPQTEVH